ncbi:MAG: hypothetical protein ABIF71_12845 [Planctomycetota bacterium]
MSSRISAILPAPAQARTLGTFGGVFTPCVLTILGAILFLRAGWVVGNAGLLGALLILVIANAITFLTTLSLSAVATNTRMEAGGVYYLISRSLGLEIGGSIGIPLFLAQTVSVAFYVIGFVESLQFILPWLDMRWAGSIALGAVFVISLFGAGFATRVQYLIMIVLGLSLAAFFAGWTPVTDWRANWMPQYTEHFAFWTVFAIFFPAVTGIMSGVSMSGDLKDPARSVPRGTLWAVGLTFVIYAAAIIWLSLNAERAELLGNNQVFKRIALVPMLVYAGIWAATLSSAIASLLAAPRTLQAMARDRVAPRVLGRGYGPTQEPRAALLVTLLIAEACILIGDLNLIAPLVTMFILATYAMINLTAALEAWVANPTFRPSFRVHWIFALAGAFGCGQAMFLVNPAATVIAALVILGVYFMLTRRHYQTAWGDMRSGFWFAVARLGLLRLAVSRPHLHNWRPLILVLVGDPASRQPLVRFADRLGAERGLMFLAQVTTGDWSLLVKQQAAAQDQMETFIRDNKLPAVAKAVLADDFEHGVSTLLQVSGLGPLKPNTVLIGWSDDEVQKQVFSRAVRRILELERNLIVFAEAKAADAELEPVIDIWWAARQNGSLMLTFAHLLREDKELAGYRVRVRRIIKQDVARTDSVILTEELITRSRIDAELDFIVDPRPPLEVIAEKSRLSAVCFVGISMPAMADKSSPLDHYRAMVAVLQGNVLLTKSWHDLEL